MKTPTPELQNTRVLLSVKRLFAFPAAAIAAAWRAIVRMTDWRKSASRRRAEDQLRQSRARRTLRGLPPDHAAEEHGR